MLTCGEMVSSGLGEGAHLKYPINANAPKVIPKSTHPNQGRPTRRAIPKIKLRIVAIPASILTIRANVCINLQIPFLIKIVALQGDCGISRIDGLCDNKAFPDWLYLPLESLSIDQSYQVNSRLEDCIPQHP